MIDVSATAVLATPADEVWSLIGDFGGVHRWHPALSSTDLEDGGRLRRVTLAQDGETVEELLDHDDRRRSYRYAIRESGLPVSDYRATLSVRDTARGARVEWSATFEATGSVDEASSAVESFLRAGTDHLEAVFGSQR